MSDPCRRGCRYKSDELGDYRPTQNPQTEVPQVSMIPQNRNTYEVSMEKLVKLSDLFYSDFLGA